MSHNRPDSDNTQKIVFETSLQSFFFDRLIELNQKSVNPLPRETIYYSSLVMDDFGKSVNYFETEDGKVRSKVLGTKLLESTQLSRGKQKRVLKEVGDTALFLCGYFSDSLKKKIVDVRYYQDLGQIAYRRLDSIVPEVYEVPSFFRQLSSSFEKIANFMSLISKRDAENSDQSYNDILLVMSDQHKIKVS